MRLFCDTICAGYINNYTDSLRFQTLVSRFSAGNDAVCAELKALFTALKEAARRHFGKRHDRICRRDRAMA